MRTKQRAGVVMMLLGISLIFSVKVFASSEDIFTDVNQTTKYQEAIEYLKNQGVVQGYENGSFQPENKINRAEFLKILIEGTGNSNLSEEDYNDCFSDVTDEWFAKYTCYAKEQGIVSGYADKSFRPGENINFAEAAKMIVNVFALEKPEDTEIWYESYVQALTENKKVPRTVVGFDYAITRGEMAEMVWRVREEESLKEGDDYVAEIRRDWMSWKGLEIQTDHPEWFTETSLMIKNNLGVLPYNNEIKKYIPFEFWETDVSELEYIFFQEGNLATNVRVDDFGDQELYFFGKQFNGSYSLKLIIIKDKNNKIYLSNKPVWSAEKINNFYFMGVQEYLGDESIDNTLFLDFASRIKDKAQFCKHLWYPIAESSVYSVTRLWKLDISDFSTEETGYFGGEELDLDDSIVRFVSYEHSQDVNWNAEKNTCNLDYYPTINQCWHSMKSDCNSLKIPVSEIDNKLNIADSSDYTSQIGEVFDVKNAFDESANYTDAIDVISSLL